MEPAFVIAAATTCDSRSSGLRLELDRLKVLLGAGSNIQSSLHSASSFTCSLIRKYLCRPRSSDEAGQRVSVLNVISGLATRLPAAFNFGDPLYIGSVILALLENLAALEDEQGQPELLETLSMTLLLLRTGSARAFACLGRELIEVLAQLAKVTAKVTQSASCAPLGPLSAFAGFARMCVAEARGEDHAHASTWHSEAGVAVRLRGPSHLALLREGLMQLSAIMHVKAPIFLGDGCPVLWAGLLNQIGRASDFAASCPPYDSQTPIEPSLRALTHMLYRHDAPATLRSRLLHRLLASLCECCTVTSIVRRSPLSPESCELLSECLEKLSTLTRLPLPPLRLLVRATASALSDNAHEGGAQLRGAIGQLWCALPPRFLAQHLVYFESYLGWRPAHCMLLPMLARALHGDSELKVNEDNAESGDDLPTAKRRCLQVESSTLAGAARQHFIKMGLSLTSSLAANGDAAEGAHELHWSAERMWALGLILRVTAGGEMARDGSPRPSQSLQLLRSPQSHFPSQLWRSLVEVFDWLVNHRQLGAPGLISLDIVIDLCSQDAIRRSMPRDFTRAALRIAALPWSSPCGLVKQRTASCVDDASRGRGGSAMQCRALEALMRLPAAEDTAFERLRIFEHILSRKGHGVEGDVPAEESTAAITIADEERVLIVAVRALPRLMALHQPGELRMCFEALHDLFALSAGGKLTGLARSLSMVIGRLACLQSGSCNSAREIRPTGQTLFRNAPNERAAMFACKRAPTHDRMMLPRCELCDSARDHEHTPLEPIGLGEAAVEESMDRMQIFLPQIWSVLLRLPAGCCRAGHSCRWHGRAELVHSLARLARHASPAELARTREMLRQLVGLLADPADEVTAACAEVLPRLLGWDTFVRVVGGLPDQQPLDARSLTQQVLAPMVMMMRDPSQTKIMLPMMRTLGALGREALYSTKPACLATIVITLCRHLAADELSLEFDCAMQQLNALGECACEPSGAAAGAAAFVSPLERLCLQLAPQLHVEWVWWAHECPKLFSAVAHRLLECSERELIEQAVSHALPNIVLLGGIMHGRGGDAALEEPSVTVTGPCALSGFVEDARQLERGRSAAALLQLIARRLERSAATLLVDHMHLILPELFVRQASDDRGELSAAIPGGLEFLFAMGINRANSPTDMVRMSAGGLLQEMVLRLGRAEGEAETRSVLLALNLLIPIGLQEGDGEYCNGASPEGSLMKSCALSNSNEQLRNYVDANFHLLMQFLRDRVRAPTLATREKAVALRALQQVLVIMKGAEISHSWWGELVATLKLALQQERLQEQALHVLHVFVTLLDPGMRARGLQQLFLMPLHCLDQHPIEVVNVLKALVWPARDAGGANGGGKNGHSLAIAEVIAEAMGELKFLSEHPALTRVKQALGEQQIRPLQPRPDELALQLRTCAPSIAHESGAVRLMALGQLRATLHEVPIPDLAELFTVSTHSYLRSQEAVGGTTSMILRQLFASCQLGASSVSSSAQDELACAAELAMQCLGEIGALDPARVALVPTARVPSRGGLGAGADVWISGHVSDAELCIRLIEDFLLKALRDASEGQVVQSAAYALTMLLQRVCKCNAETPTLLRVRAEMIAEHTGGGSSGGHAAACRIIDDEQRKALELWGGLSEAAQRTVHPYLTLHATLSHERRRVSDVCSDGVPLDKATAAMACVFIPGIRYSDWLIGWARQLQHQLARLRELPRAEALPQNALDRGELLLACEPYMRFDPHLVQLLLPHIVELLLLYGSSELRGGIRRELRGVLAHAPAKGDAAAEHQLCCQAVFSVLDTLSSWHWQCLHAADVLRQRKSSERSNGRRCGNERDRSESARVAVLAAFLRSLSELELARAALRCGAQCRAIRSLEALANEEDPVNHRHFVRPRHKSRQLRAEAGALMHRALTKTGELDGLLGLSLIREQTSLEEEALELELTGRYGAALYCYQLALRQPPSVVMSLRSESEEVAAAALGAADVTGVHAARAFKGMDLDSQLGLCRSLCCLGLFSQLKDAAESALRLAVSQTERCALASHAVQAAWRLGEWDEVQRLLCAHPIRSPDGATASAIDGEHASESHESVYELELARALLALHCSTPAAISKHCRRARQAILPLLAAASMDSYSHAYPCLVKLQSLQELQESVPLLTGGAHARYVASGQQKLIPSSDLERADVTASALDPLPLDGCKCAALVELLKKWQLRVELMANSPQELEPVLAVRCCVLRELLSIEASAGVGSSKQMLSDIALEGLSTNWLRLAKSARAANNAEIAAHAVMQAGIYERSGAVLLSTKMDWEAGRTHRAIARIRQQQGALLAAGAASAAGTTAAAGTSVSVEAAAAASIGRLGSYYPQHLLMQTSLQLARFSEQAGECEGAELLELHSRVVDLSKGGNPNWAKGHFWLGYLRDQQLGLALEAAAQDLEVVPPGGQASAPRRVPVAENVKGQKRLKVYNEHLANVFHSYGRALKHEAKYAPRSLPRLLTLWFDFSDLQAHLPSMRECGEATEGWRNPHVQMERLIRSNADRLPCALWLPSVAQLVSRVCLKNSRARKLVHELLATLLAEYPRQLVWSVIPCAMSEVAERRCFGETIVAKAKHQLIGGRVAEVDSLTKATKLIEQLKRLANDVAMDKHEKRISMKARWRELSKMRSLPVVMPVYDHLTAADPWMRSLDAVHAPFARDAPAIEGFEDTIEVMSSLCRPKKLTMRGSDGNSYIFLCKPKDDLRKDARVMEFMTCINRQLRKSAQCRHRRLVVRCYAVTPLDSECGLIEWVPNMIQLRSIIKGYWDSFGIPFSHMNIKRRFEIAHKERALHARTEKLAMLCKSLMDELPPVLHHWLLNCFRDPSMWFEARLAFTRSCAVMSMIGFTVGLGDRHLENVLINSDSGSLMHVDFACLFDHGKNLLTPEQVPFRLTQNLLHSMGVCAADGLFRRVSELTLEQVRNHKHTLLNVLSTMRHDPLVDWIKRNDREDASGMRDSEEAEKELAKIDLKLRGVLLEHGPNSLSVQGQVQQLISDATNINNLARMYIWWMPWC